VIARDGESFGNVAEVSGHVQKSNLRRRVPDNLSRKKDDDARPRRKLVYLEAMVPHFDNISHAKSPSSSGFDFAVHLDFSALDHQLGLPARFRNATQLQELIQTESIRFGLDVIFGRSHCLILGSGQSIEPVPEGISFAWKHVPQRV